MFDSNLRLISILGLLTSIVIVSLALAYWRLISRPRLGIGIAVVSIIAGFALTLLAVLPGNGFYGPVYSKAKTKEKIVALTFDDGPYPPYTNQILDILKEYDVPATFFVVGQNAAKHPDLICRIVAEGHQLGNHTYNHIDLLKADRRTIAAEIERTNQLLAEIVGFEPKVARPPHGFRDAVVMDVITKRGMKVVDWSVMSRDWLNPGVNVIVQRTIGNVKNGSIILLHDGDGVAASASRAQTVEATRHIIRELLQEGYTFVTVDEIINNTED